MPRFTSDCVTWRAPYSRSKCQQPVRLARAVGILIYKYELHQGRKPVRNPLLDPDLDQQLTAGHGGVGGTFSGIIEAPVASLEIELGEANRQIAGTVALSYIFLPPFIPASRPWSTVASITRTHINYSAVASNISPWTVLKSYRYSRETMTNPFQSLLAVN